VRTDRQVKPSFGADAWCHSAASALAGRITGLASLDDSVEAASDSSAIARSPTGMNGKGAAIRRAEFADFSREKPFFSLRRRLEAL
jgi:hypothetical protein